MAKILRFRPYERDELERMWGDKLRPDQTDFLCGEGLISKDEMLELRGNSYFWKAITPRFDNEALAWQLQHTVANCMSIEERGRYQTDVTYEQKLVSTLIPIVLDRLSKGV